MNIFYKYVRLCNWLEEDDQWFYRMLLLVIGGAIILAEMLGTPLTDLSTWGYAFLFSVCYTGIMMAVIGVFEMIGDRYGQAGAGFGLLLIGFISLLVIGSYKAEACETDVCTQRLNAYLACDKEAFLSCEVHRRAAEKACGV